MRETERIAALYESFYAGDCWIGLNFRQAMDHVDANMAQRKTQDTFNSIWQLVNHLIYWRETVIIRLQGILGHPPMNDFYEPENTSEDEWHATLQRFEAVNNDLLAAIRSFDDARLDEPSPQKGQCYYQLLMGSLQHDAYHLGQIIMMKKNWTLNLP